MAFSDSFLRELEDSFLQHWLAIVDGSRYFAVFIFFGALRVFEEPLLTEGKKFMTLVPGR